MAGWGCFLMEYRWLFCYFVIFFFFFLCCAAGLLELMRMHGWVYVCMYVCMYGSIYLPNLTEINYSHCMSIISFDLVISPPTPAASHTVLAFVAIPFHCTG